MNCGTIGTISSSYTQAVWSGSNRITINRPASDLTDFTFLFTGTYEFLRTTANGGLVTNASGFDIAFYTDGGLTSIMKFERAYWSATTGECEFWVKIPTLSSSFNTVIYIAYGNSAISTDLSDAANAWDTNTKAVYHYGNGTSLSVTDSIGVNNGTINGTVVATTGKVDGAASFDGSTGYVDNGSDASLETNLITYSAWIYPESAMAQSAIFGGDNNNNIVMYISGQVLLLVSLGSAGISNTGNVITLNAWNFVAVSYNVTTGDYVLYYNGTYVTGTNLKGTSWLGNRRIGNSLYGEYFDGKIDEAKYASVIRTEDWMDAEYANQNSPSTFYTIT